jgi:3-methyl-2-oxobutanoate hydroxymethyltransferase
MIHHVQAVSRGIRNATLNQVGMPPIPLLIADLPYGIAQGTLEGAVEACTALVKEGGADGIKIEGSEEILPLVQRLTTFGMPIMGHIGLQPQKASSSSDYQLQGRSARKALELLQCALQLEQAGAFSAVLECIPTRVGTEVSKRVQMATIGIGAGGGTDGQVLVADDVLGECTSPFHVLAQANNGSPDLWPIPPRFVRNFTNQVIQEGKCSTIGQIRLGAVQAYVQAVKKGDFPNSEEGYKMNKEEWIAFKILLDEHDKAVGNI